MSTLMHLREKAGHSLESDENKSPLPFQEVVGIALGKELIILRIFCIIYFKEFPHVSNIEIIKINHLSCLFGDFLLWLRSEK